MTSRNKYYSLFKKRKWEVFPFQEEVLDYYSRGFSGLLNAPTGSGKTLALFLPFLVNQPAKVPRGLKMIWLTPVRALARDIEYAMSSACKDLGLDWYIGVRTGDTNMKERKKQKEIIPDVLITTPESLHLMLAAKGYEQTFKNLQVVVVDEWHELLGTKRGIQVELGLSRLKALRNIQIWGVSATIGNLEEALDVLLGPSHKGSKTLVKAGNQKKIVMTTLMPDEIETYPWAGHLGVKLIDKILPVIRQGGSTLLFTNTRSQAEIWFQRLLDFAPDLAGIIALHHGSLSNEIRAWVEQALHDGRIKVTVCTSSLDLGVDFRPVDTVIQVGSPKGIARFLQRAGRSGHSPYATSQVYFVPTHSLELLEASALQEAIIGNKVEPRIPLVRTFDVLVQYLVTLAVSDGFYPDTLLAEILGTHAFRDMTGDEFQEILNFISTGGPGLQNYPDYSKVIIYEGKWVVTDRKIALRHRLSIGTIVGDPLLSVKYMSGTFIGTIEESFIGRLNKGDVFSFAGKKFEYLMVKDMTVFVRKAESAKPAIPQWMGGKMNLSSQLSHLIRKKLSEAFSDDPGPEIRKLLPLLEQQKSLSHLPSEKDFLVERHKSREGYHQFFYTFEGRYVNEGLASLFAYRYAKNKPGTFSIAMNDYGFELLSAEESYFSMEQIISFLSSENLILDVTAGMNTTEMARRKFRNIAHIAGLVFQGYPGRNVRMKHLQASSRLFFEVFRDFEPNHFLLRQAYEEVLFDQLDEVRLREALKRISTRKVIIKELSVPSPFCFPIMVEMFREKMSNEKVEDKIKKILDQVKKKEQERDSKRKQG